MKLLLTFFGLYLFAFNTAFSQLEDDLTWSPVLEKQSNEFVKKIIEGPSKSVWIFSYNPDIKNSININVLDSNAQLLAKNNINLGDSKIIDAFYFDQSIYLFSKSQIPSEKVDAINAIKINQKAEQSAIIPIFKSKSNGGYHNNFHLSVSPDRSKCAVICSPPYREGHHEEITVALFEGEFDKIHETHINTKIPGHKKRTTVGAVNDNGFVYIIKKHRERTKTAYNLFTFDKGGSHHHAAIHAKSYKIADMTYTMDKDGALIVGGFYSNPARKNFEGVFVSKYPENVHSTYHKTFVFNQQIIEKLKDKKAIKESGYGLDKFHAKQMFIDHQTDDVYLFAEHHSVLVDKKLGAMDSREGLICVKINKNGIYQAYHGIRLDQLDARNAGKWSSSYIDQDETSLLIFHNRVNDKEKSSEENLKHEAAFPIQTNSINAQGLSENNLEGIDAGFENFGIITTYSSHSYDLLMTVGVESKNDTQFKVGFKWLNLED